MSIYELNRFSFFPEQDVNLSPQLKDSAFAAIEQWQKRDYLSHTVKLVSLDCVVLNGELKVLSVDRTPQGLELLKLRQKEMLPVTTDCHVGLQSKNHYGFCGGLNEGGVLFPEHPGFVFDTLENAQDSGAPGPYNFLVPYNKYGENWLWESVSSDTHTRIIDYDRGVSFKAKNQRKIFICPPKEARRELRKRKIGGNRTVSQMTRVLAEHGEMYYQYFIPPMESPVGTPMIYSLYFQYDCNKHSFAYIGGLSISRRNLHVVLNASDVVLGLIN